MPAGSDFADVINPFTNASGKARKGTVAATLNNIALLDQLLLNHEELQQIMQIEKELSKLISSLEVIGIFDLFILEEWIRDEKRLGRIYLSALYLQQKPHAMNKHLRVKLTQVAQTTKSTPLKTLLEKLLP